MADMSPDDMVGLIFFNMLTPEDLKIVKEQLGSLSPENPIETHEQIHIASDGSKHWHQWTNRAFFDGKGRAINFRYHRYRHYRA